MLCAVPATRRGRHGRPKSRVGVLWRAEQGKPHDQLAAVQKQAIVAEVLIFYGIAQGHGVCVIQAGGLFFRAAKLHCNGPRLPAGATTACHAQSAMPAV